MGSRLNLLLLLSLLWSPSYGWADSPSAVSPPLNIVEVDGSPSTYPYALKVPNGTLTDNGDGTSTITYAGAPSGGVFTAGSIPFGDGTASLAQNNANVFWDNTNNRLGIGTTSPLDVLHVVGIARIKAAATETGVLRIGGRADLGESAYVSASDEYHLTGTSNLIFVGMSTLIDSGQSARFRFIGNGSSATIAGGGTGSSGNGLVLSGMTSTASSGTDPFVSLLVTSNQSGSAGNTAFLVNKTNTATGSGEKNLLNLQIGSASKFRVDDGGFVEIGEPAGAAAGNNGTIRIWRPGQSTSYTEITGTGIQWHLGASSPVDTQYTIGPGATTSGNQSGVNMVLVAQSGNGGTAVGGNLILGSGASQGTGLNGSILFRIAEFLNYPGGATTAGTQVMKLGPDGALTHTIITDIASGDAITFNSSASIELTASSGTQNWINVAPKINQSGTAGYTGLLVNATETATGSGTKRLLDLQVGSAAKLSVGNGGLITNYNSVATTGWGVPAIYASGRSTAQTAAVASVSTYTVGAADGSFLVSANVNVTTSTTHNFTVTCAYTDETNTARTLTLSFFALAGGAPISSITNVTGAGPYEGAPVHIRCKAATAITIATTGTFTTVTYNVEGSILQIS